MITMPPFSICSSTAGQNQWQNIVSVGGRRIEHRWYEFGTSDIENGNLVFKRDSEARPFPVNAGSALSHETLFSPWEIDCAEGDTGCDPRANYLKWDEFLAAIRATHQLSFTTTGLVYSGKAANAVCVVRLRRWEIDLLEKIEWLAPACIETSASGPVERKGQTAMAPPAASP